MKERKNEGKNELSYEARWINQWINRSYSKELLTGSIWSSQIRGLREVLQMDRLRLLCCHQVWDRVYRDRQSPRHRLNEIIGRSDYLGMICVRLYKSSKFEIQNYRDFLAQFIMCIQTQFS